MGIFIKKIWENKKEISFSVSELSFIIFLAILVILGYAGKISENLYFLTAFVARIFILLIFILIENSEMA